MQFQKISILSPQKGLEFPEGWGGGFCKAKNNIEMYKANWNFQRGGGIPSTGRYGYFLELPVHNTKRLPMVS